MLSVVSSTVVLVRVFTAVKNTMTMAMLTRKTFNQRCLLTVLEVRSFITMTRSMTMCRQMWSYSSS